MKSQPVSLSPSGLFNWFIRQGKVMFKKLLNIIIETKKALAKRHLNRFRGS